MPVPSGTEGINVLLSWVAQPYLRFSNCADYPAGEIDRTASDIIVVDCHLTNMDADPNPDRSGPGSDCSAIAKSNAVAVARKTAKKPSPVVLTSRPSCSPISLRP